MFYRNVLLIAIIRNFNVRNIFYEYWQVLVVFGKLSICSSRKGNDVLVHRSELSVGVFVSLWKMRTVGLFGKNGGNRKFCGAKFVFAESMVVWRMRVLLGQYRFYGSHVECVLPSSAAIAPLGFCFAYFCFAS